ncbi:MAG: hypothetical protein HOK41_02875 [Nitrospina sp.]|jgi:hypothetical protein|nr:hypothetical protein [Nitrospina sp.]MBT6717484.1 hypothetical protein [Nitrospina sp.]
MRFAQWVIDTLHPLLRACSPPSGEVGKVCETIVKGLTELVNFTGVELWPHAEWGGESPQGENYF